MRIPDWFAKFVACLVGFHAETEGTYAYATPGSSASFHRTRVDVPRALARTVVAFTTITSAALVALAVVMFPVLILPIVGIVASGIALTNPVSINFGLPWNMRRRRASLRGFLQLRSFRHIRKAIARGRQTVHSNYRAAYKALATALVVAGLLTSAHVIGFTVPFYLSAVSMTALTLTSGAIGFDHTRASFMVLTQTTTNMTFGNTRDAAHTASARTADLVYIENRTGALNDSATASVSTNYERAASAQPSTDLAFANGPALNGINLTVLGAALRSPTASNDERVLDMAQGRAMPASSRNDNICDFVNTDVLRGIPVERVTGPSATFDDNSAATTLTQALSGSRDISVASVYDDINANHKSGTDCVTSTPAMVPTPTATMENYGMPAVRARNDSPALFNSAEDESTYRTNLTDVLREADSIVALAQKTTPIDFHRRDDRWLGFFPVGSLTRTMQVLGTVPKNASTSDGMFRHDVLDLFESDPAERIGNPDSRLLTFSTATDVSGARKLARVA